MASSDSTGFCPIERKVILGLLGLVAIIQVVFLGFAIVMFRDYKYWYWY